MLDTPDTSNTPDEQQLRDLADATIVSFVMNEKDVYVRTRTHKHINELGENETVTLTIMRFTSLPVHPLPVMDAVKELIPA